MAAKRENNKNKVFIKRDRAIINKKLKWYLNKTTGPAFLSKMMRYAVLGGGKRLRPILAMESARALGGDIKSVIPFACAIELVHNFSLVHDDLPAMDNDDTRRGNPTCHKKFGEGHAILIGDALLNLAFGIIAKVKTKRSREAMFILTNAVGTGSMIGGQALELACRDSAGRMRIFKNRIDVMKTAAIMGASCEIGAVMAGGKAGDGKKMRRYGRNLGRAFQIADDITDCRLSESEVKKIRSKAKFFISKAKKEIKSLGQHAGVLGHIADSIL